MASFISRKASVHLYFFGLPIDLRVVVLEPGITEDHVLLSEAGVGRAVHVVHQYGARDALSVNTFHMDEVSIYKVAHSSGVQKRLDGVHLAGVSSADFYWEDNQHSVGIKDINGELFG